MLKCHKKCLKVYSRDFLQKHCVDKINVCPAHQWTNVSVVNLYLLNGGIPNNERNVLAPKSSSNVCLPLVWSLLHSDWSVLSHCSSSQLIPAAGFWGRSAQDWTWCHQSPVMRLNNQAPWPLNRKEEGTRTQILTDLTWWRKWGAEIEMIEHY